MIIIKSSKFNDIGKYSYVWVNDNAIYATDDENIQRTMGYYGTHERAVEVFGMITNHIEDVLTEKQYINDSRVSGFKWIFEMPNE